jgi:tRNA 2-selenouridine synthase
MYAQSIERNFIQFGQALPCPLTNRSVESLAEAARQLMASEAAAASS